MSWAEYKKKRKEQENINKEYNSVEVSSWQRYKEKRAEQDLQQKETNITENSVIAPVKIINDLTNTNVKKIEQNTESKIKNSNMNSLQKESVLRALENTNNSSNMLNSTQTLQKLEKEGAKIKKVNPTLANIEYVAKNFTKNAGDAVKNMNIHLLANSAKNDERWADAINRSWLPDYVADDYSKEKDRKLERIAKLYEKVSTPVEEPVGLTEGGRVAGQVSGTIGRMAPSVALSLVPGAGSVLSSTSMGMNVSGEDIGERLNEGKDLKQATLSGNLKGLTSMGIEKITGGIKIGGKGALDDIVGNAIARKTTNNITNFLATKGYQMAGEIAEENIENIADYAIDKIVNNKDFPDWKTIWAEAKETSKMTFLTTLTLNCLGLGGENLSTYKEMENITGKTLTKTQKESLNRVIEDVQDKIQKTEAPELAQNVQNNIEQQTIQTSTKTAQNQNMSQINNDELQTRGKNINVPVKELDYFETAKKYNIDTKNDTVQSIARVTNEREIKARYDADVFNDNSQNAIWKISKDNNGNITREVIINPNADTKKSLENIAIHELTHDLEGTEQYNKLRDLILEYDKTKSGYQEARQSLEELYSNVYDKNSEEFNTLVDSEAVADILGSKLGNQEFVNNLTIKNKNLGQRIYSWVIDKLNRLNAKLGYKSEKIYWTDIKNKFENAFKQEYQGLDTNKTKLSIQQNNNGKYVKADRQVITGNDSLKWETQVENYINNNIRQGKDVQVETESGDILTITKDTAGKAKFRNKITDKNGNTRYLNNKEFLSKLTAETHVDELAQISQKINKKPIPDYKNHKFARDGFDYRSAYFEDFDGQYYKITMSVGKNGSIDTIYNIGKMDKKNRSKSSLVAQRPSDKNITSNEDITSTNSIAPIKDDVNTTTKYSMQESEKKSGSFSLSENNKWQERLDTLYKNDSKGTTIIEAKAPIEKNVKRVEKTAPIGENVVMYNNYKKKIIKTQENAINNLIKYKNFSISNIDETIRKKENIINGKKNKDTKTVAIIKSQIENLKIRKNKIEDLYLSKIDKVNKNSTKEKVELETRNMMKKASRETITAEIAPLVSDLTKYEDKKSGILYNRETAQRNIEDIVKDKELAKTINEVIFNPIQVHQAQKTREINELYEKINKLDLDKTQKYLYVPKGENIAIKIDEATLAQLIIEKKINDTDLRKYNLSNEKIQKIYKTANTFKEILDYLHPRINDEQIKFGFSPIGKRENYFPHFFENKPDMFLGKVASYFGIDLSNNNSLPTEIAGKTDTFKPGRTWNSNIQKRKTNKTDYNALKAMEKYIQGAMELIYTTEDIQKVREFSRQIRYKFSDKGMQNEINNIYKNKELTQEAKDSAIDGIFKNTESGLPNFVTWLDDYANTLAGKKSFADRNIEHNIGRNVYTSMAGIESKIAANTIGGNLSVSLTNFAPIFQAAGTTKWNYLLTGILQTAKNDIQGLRGNKDLSFVSNSNFLTNRFGIDTIAKKKITQKMSDIASIPMNVIDNFTAESVVRAKYLENIDKGMSEEIALDSADKYAARIMADRSKGALPLVFNSKNPLSKLITMFQVEPNNMVSNYLKDMPREAKNKGQLIWHYSKLMAASWGVNTIMIALRGGNEVLPDPVRWVSYLIQAILGDDDDKEKAKEDLAESVIGSIPFLSNLAGFVGMEDIGRVPISNAMPNITNIAKLADSEADEKYKKEIAIKEFTKPLLYLGLPVGGAQIKKSIEGISTINAGGSYKTNKSGESQLQFPVENKTVKKYIKAGLFGKYSISDAKEFSERGYKALSSKQTEGYKKVQIPYKEFLEYIDNTSGKKKNEKIQYIEKMNINENKKWNMYTYDVFSATERNDGGSQLKDAEYITKNGTSKAEYIRIYNKANENELSMPTKEEYDNLRKNGLELETFIDYKIKIKELSNKLSLKEEKMKSNDKINILLKSNYSAKEKSAIYKTKILTNDSAKEKFELLEKTGITDEKYINEYLKYLQQDFESDIKENGTTKGKTVSGSSKKKTYEYVNNMKITYEQKLMLLGTQYKLNDTERTKLYKYVKSLDYTEDEMKSVFESLKGFTVYKNGKVTW
jgi:hypothetical protein